MIQRARSRSGLPPICASHRAILVLVRRWNYPSMGSPSFAPRSMRGYAKHSSVWAGGRALARTGGGGLAFTDTPASLTLRATLPRTGEADDALTNIRARVLRGLSMEFVPKRERFENSVRIVDEAVLVGIGLVDRPQYGDSTVAARAWTQARDDRLTLPRRIFF